MMIRIRLEQTRTNKFCNNVMSTDVQRLSRILDKGVTNKVTITVTYFIKISRYKVFKGHKSEFEPQHDKTNKIACAPSEDTHQPGHPPNERTVKTDQTGQMLMLIRVFAGRTGHFVAFVKLGPTTKYFPPLQNL